MKHFFRFFTILLVITFSIIATESYGQDQNGLYLSVVKQTPPSSSIIEICSGENIALYGNTSGTAVERLIFEYYNKTSNTWQVLSSTFRNFDFSNVGAFAFKEALPDNIESQDYRLRYFINQVEYITPNFSINVRPGSSAGGISPRTYTICYGSSPPDLTLQGTVGTTIRWQSSFTSSTGTYTDMSPAITTVTLPGSAINNFQTGYYRAIVQNSYCTPDTLSVPITITVTPLNTIGLSSASGTESQTVCISTPIANLTFATTGATGATSTTLPTGLSGSWSAGVFTVSGTPTVAGTYSFTITTSGGCGVVSTTASLVVTPNNTIRLSSISGTDVQTVCINTAITSVTYTTEGATNATFAGLPAGVSGAWLDNIVTISGTPTASGTFTYTITLTGGCGVITKTGTIKVNAVNSITLSSAVGTESQIVCINTPITNLTYATITATGASSTTLPAGLNGSWSAGVYTVSGTPTVAGTYSFTITTTGGCGVASTTASLVVTPNNTITQSSAAGTDSQTVCINTAITSVTYTTTGATGATFAGLPAGVDAAWSSNVVTISGTPTASGTFTYTITLTGGCGIITKTGTIVVTPNNTITLSSAAGTDSQTVCINTAITSATYTTTGATNATFAGLPAGVSGAWLNNVVTISGTPTVSGTFSYTITLTGGCGVITKTGTIKVNALNTIGLSSAVGTESQTVCISTPIANLTFATTGATGATSTTLPTGLSGSWSAGVFTVSGTPTVAGTYSFTITTTGGCGVASTTASLVVTPNNTITLSSVAGTDSQTVCINTAITSVTYTTTGATGATFAGLPAGVSGAWLDNIVTISGTPTASGTFTYTITLTGGCGVITKIGTIKVNALNTIGLSSAVGTESQIVCINTPITNLTYATITATGASSTTLPAGLNGSWSAGVYTVSGTPTVAGTYSFTITTTGGCGVASTTASLVVTPNNTITQSSAAGTDSQTVCINTAITSVTYTTTGATGATFAGLPAGVDAAWSSNVVTISGTPTASGTFTYTITLTGGCGVITKTGTIVVTPNNTITLSSAAGTNAQTVCINGTITNIRYTTTIASGATVTGLPTGLTYGWSANALTISGTVTVAGTYTYTATTTGGCSVASATGTIVVTAANTIGLSSAVGTESQTVCISTPIANLTFATTGATGATSTTLPTGLSGSWSAGVFTVSGTPTVAGTYSFTITTTGGCGVASTTASLVVTPNNTITLSSVAGTDSQTVCINTAITSVTYTTTGATGATFAGLPAGVSGAWLDNIVTISGTPTASGTFTYTITLTGGCGVITKIGTIKVNALNTIGLSSAVGTESQIVCINTPITNLTYATITATGASSTTLPAGLNGSWSAGVYTVSGTPTVAGTYSFTITTTGGCGVASTTASLVVTPNNTITQSSAAGTDSQTVCINTAITSVTYTTTGATGATFAGLPAGVDAAWSSNVVTISGTPTASGTFTYTITLTGGCGVITKTGTIVVTPNNTITLSSAAGTNAQTVCINGTITNIRYTTTIASGATVTGLPTGLTYGWSANALTISGTVTVAGTYTYTATTTGGCSVASATGTIVVTAANTIGLSSAVGTESQTVCISTPIANLTFATTGATGATSTTLPTGLSGSWSAGVFTVSGTPTVAGTYSFTITTTGGCGVASTTASLVVTPNNTITLSSVAGTDSQTVCINTAITSITYTTTVATNATFAGLPAGVDGAWLNNIVTISGTPTVSGTYNYTITLTGGCGIITKNGIIVVSQQSVAGNVAITTGSSTICSNSSKPIITLSGNTGLTIKWQSSLDGTNFSDISPAQTERNINTAINNIASGNTQVVTYYLAIVKSGACLAVSTSPVSITVDPIPQLTAIVSNEKTQQVCIGISAIDVNLTTNVGTIVWKYSSTSGSGYLPFSPNQTNSTLSNSVINTNNAGTTYYKAFVTSGVCAAVQSEEIVVQVDAETVAGSIASASNLICNGSTPPTITLTGNTGSTIKWQTRLASATYVDPIASQTGSSISSVVNNSAPASSQVVNYYQAIVKSGACNPLTTNEVAVAVDPSSKVGLIEPLQKNQEICIGSSATSIVLPSHTGTIQWQTANLGGSYADITGLTNATLLFGNIATNVAGTKIYRAQVTSGVCPAIYSEIATVQVDAETVAGSIASASNLICNGSTPPTITLTGNTGSTIKWQTRLASATYVDPIASQTGSSISSVVNNIAPASSQVVNYYQAIVKSGACNPLTTNEVAVAVDPSSKVGLIEPLQKNQEICIGSSATSIALPSHTGTIQWQTANLGGSYADITGLTNATLLFGNIATNVAGTKIYRAQVTSGVCPAIYSEIATVRVDAETVAGSIASTSSLICNGSTPPTISLTGNTGSTIKWQTRLASATYVDPIASQTGSSISSVVNNIAPASSQVVNYYQAIVKSGACNPLTTNEVAVAVDPSSKVGLIEPLQKNQEICIGSSATSIALPSHTGTIQWQTANLGGSYADITGLTNATLLFGNIATNVAGTKIYRAQVTSGVCPAIYSEIATVQVDATTVAGDAYFLNGNSSICNLGDKPTISIKNNTGTNIVWQITTVSNSNSVIGTANSLNYTNTNNIGNLLNSGIDNTASGAISSFKYYRASVRNGVCKTEFTQPIELEVIPTPIVTKVVPAERCGLGNVEILAESNLGIPNWFEANSGGAAIVSANTFITPLLNSSTNYYAGAIFRGCVSFDRTAVLAKIKPIPSVTSVINANNCGPGNLELSATVSGGIVNWFTDANAGSSLLTAPKYTTPSISNTTTYYAEALLDGCTSSPRTPVVATIFEVPTFNPLPDLFSLCAGLRLSLSNYVALGAPPYNYIFNTNNGNVMGQKDGYLLGVKGGITDVYFNVKDMNGCISQNTNSFQVKTYDPVKPKIFFQEAFYDFSTIIKTKVDSGYSVYDWSPTMNLDFYNDKDPVFRGINNVTYALYRLDTTSNCLVTDTYNITVTTDFIFNLPNAFTPNFDGLNDVIKSVYNSGIASLNFLKIYNRNGNIVFQTSLLSAGWDGRVNGVDQDADAYYWTAEYVTRKSETFRKSGSFLLIK